MKIAIDISQTAYEGSGVARYTETLIRSLLHYDNKNQYTCFYSSLRRAINPTLLTFLKGRSEVKLFPFPPSLLEFIWNKLHIVPIDIFVGKQDLIITSDWCEPPSQARKITILHDLIIFKYPETFNNFTSFKSSSLTVSPNIIKTHKRRLEHVKKESALIICDSKSTKLDAQGILNIDEKKLTVIYPAVATKKPTPEQIQQTCKRYALTKPFILSVGKIEPRKNIKKLIDAYNSAQLKDIQLVVVGKLGWEEEQIIQKNPNIIFTGFVSDVELYSLYNQALFFIYPSLYEGFGLPIVEAMSLGCPTATSNTSSMKEIGEGFSYLFDPNNLDEIKDTLIKLSTHKELRDDLKKKGLVRAKDFTESIFAEKFMNVIQSL
jgi:glycosyltransferase involved in cell wall biosynthesis